MSPGDDPSSGASSAEKDITVVVPPQDAEAPGVSPVEEVVRALVMSPDDDLEEDITAAAPATDSEAPGVTPAEEATTASVTSRGADTSPGASSAEQDKTAVVPAQDEASDRSEDRWDLCLFLHCDPKGRPYKKEDFRNALKELKMDTEVARIKPMTPGKAWLLKVKTREAWEKLASCYYMRVKGLYCAISVLGEPETWVKVFRVPLWLSNQKLGYELSNHFGLAKKVSCREWSWPEEKADSTTRYVRLCLKKGLEEKDIPYVWFCFESDAYPIVVKGRPPLCFRCHTIGHMKRECDQPPCTDCDRLLQDTRALSGGGGEPLTSDAEEKQRVLVEPGDVLVAPTAASGSQEQSVSNQKTATVVEETPAEEPHEVTGADTETGNASAVTRRGSDSEGDIMCSSEEAK
ncbi:hypothetical protein HPB52_013076 [Rhipicephalus sanguineus]|uniref:CCHC-type domain-containing protein n=1 Tax=Rhipicephalus sanguineus TaxID=34632 RepID=A0A9D4PDI9_RHISA|nr:hypothetical protein HPB52_013076 [Rhipicephalus sanguineus]